VNPNIRVDIHIHTRASDGVWSPQELLEELRREEIGFFAVTDHDSTANVPATQALAREAELHFLPAVEINTSLDGRIVHILGYDIDIEERKLQLLLHENRSLMQHNDYAILQVLEKDDFPIDWQKFEHYSYDPSRGGFKALNFCIDEGFCSDVSDFFGRLFAPPRQIPFPRYPHPKETITAIRNAGGVPIMAHPFGSIGGTGDGNVEELFQQLLNYGIHGMECHTPYHTAQQTSFTRSFCDEHGLLITGGSDTHGHFTVRRKLGRPKVFASQLRLGELLERAEHTVQH